MWQTVITTPIVAAVLTGQLLLSQTPMKPTPPGTPGDPAWQGILRLSDGRTFVTDGGLAIDAALAKPAKLPERQLAAKVLEDYLKASHENEYAFTDLRAAVSGRTYTAPNGIALNATYINYLQRTLPAGSFRFRMTEAIRPVVIFANGRAVGVLMPVKQ